MNIAYITGREDKSTNNRAMIPTLKHNAAAGYQGAVKIELLKGVALLQAHNLLDGVKYG